MKLLWEIVTILNRSCNISMITGRYWGGLFLTRRIQLLGFRKIVNIWKVFEMLITRKNGR
jgi:hypothetical protein